MVSEVLGDGLHSFSLPEYLPIIYLSSVKHLGSGEMLYDFESDLMIHLTLTRIH